MWVFLAVNPGYTEDSFQRDGSYPITVDMAHRIPLERRHSASDGRSWARHGNGALHDASELISELPSRQLGMFFQSVKYRNISGPSVSWLVNLFNSQS